MILVASLSLNTLDGGTDGSQLTFDTMREQDKNSQSSTALGARGLISEDSGTKSNEKNEIGRALWRWPNKRKTEQTLS